MSDFFRFPHTPHLAWLGKEKLRDDKKLSLTEVEALLSRAVVVEEKLDGANLGISLSQEGVIQFQNRGQYLIEPFKGQFSRLNAWVDQHRYSLIDQLDSELILFGEWCAVKHSLDYDALPDWFLVFDVFDRKCERFWSSQRRNELANSLMLPVPPMIFQGTATKAELIALLEVKGSHFRQGALEGIVIRQELSDWCDSRAKLVRSEFTQTIDTHWSHRHIQWNQMQAQRTNTQ
ncbi:MAG: RNA ligase family protein [Magnetococcales bacterium]|nr:RNA ligase family protein [Magnetococcales bacterium]